MGVSKLSKCKSFCKSELLL